MKMELLPAKGLFDGLRPEPIITVSEWADEFRFLSEIAASEPGRWRTSRTPYLKEVMDHLSAHYPTKEVIVQKGAQIGFTEAGLNWIGYIMDNAPGPALLVMPTESTAKRNSKIRLEPMIKATPQLRTKVAAAKSRDKSNTILSKEFPGGILNLSGANAAQGLRSLPIRYLFLDEIDAYPLDLDGEGSPIELAEKRTNTFSKKKIFKISTPTIAGISVIEKEFERTDQRYFHVPCPECDHFQPLVFRDESGYRLVWDKGEPSTARFLCESCGSLIEERFKTKMLARGKWVQHKPENESKDRVGFHLNSLYSPYGWYSWAEAAEEWEKAQTDQNKLKVFVNTVLGETWEEEGEVPEWELLYQSRESYPVNKPFKEVCFITAGVDVQKDRLELEIVGWIPGKQSQSIDYRAIQGDTAKKPVWDELAKVVSETWESEDGRVLPLTMMAVDTGYNTTHAYDFCRRFTQRQVIPIKGTDRLGIMIGQPSAVDRTSSGRRSKKIMLWNIGVGIAKAELYGWLRARQTDEQEEAGEYPDGYCHFPEYGRNYFRGLTAEKLLIKKDRRGFKKYEWVKQFERNEPLDCRVYARAAAAIIGMDRFVEEDWQNMRGQTANKKAAPKKKRRNDSGGSFW